MATYLSRTGTNYSSVPKFAKYTLLPITRARPHVLCAAREPLRAPQRRSGRFIGLLCTAWKLVQIYRLSSGMYGKNLNIPRAEPINQTITAENDFSKVRILQLRYRSA